MAKKKEVEKFNIELGRNMVFDGERMAKGSIVETDAEDVSAGYLIARGSATKTNKKAKIVKMPKPKGKSKAKAATAEAETADGGEPFGNDDE